MHILIVEDQRDLAMAVVDWLERRGHQTEWAGDIAAAKKLLENNPFDLLILDRGLPDGDGIVILKLLRDQNNDLPILIMTARDTLDERVQAFDLGADDYLVKPVALTELEARCRANFRRLRGNNYEGEQLRIGLITLNTHGKVAYLKDKRIDLTSGEWRMLKILMQNVGRIMSKEQLLSFFEKPEQPITLNAIEAIISRLRSKIEGGGITIRTVRGLGYLIEDAYSPHPAPVN